MRIRKKERRAGNSPVEKKKREKQIQAMSPGREDWPSTERFETCAKEQKKTDESRNGSCRGKEISLRRPRGKFERTKDAAWGEISRRIVRNERKVP